MFYDCKELKKESQTKFILKIELFGDLLANITV